MITSHDLDRFGKQASKAYISNSDPLNNTIEKIATDNGLNFHQISRVVESANTDTYLQMMKTAEDNYVDFPLADAKEVHQSITSSTNKVAALNDYDLPPSKRDTVGTSDFEKNASTNSTRSISEIEKDAKYIEGVHTFLLDESHNVRSNFIDTYDNIWHMTKQAMLGDTNFNTVMQIIEKSAPNYFDFIKDDFSKVAKAEMPFNDLTKEASISGAINPTSSLYTACTDLEYNGDRYAKILEAAASYEDKYEALEKEAAGIGSGIKNLAVGAAQAGGGLVREALKALSKPSLVLGGIGLGLAYWGGKAKGRKEQGEILQSRMMAPKYRQVLH